MWIKDENGNWRRVHHTMTQDALDTIAQELERRYAAGEPRPDIEEYCRRYDELFGRPKRREDGTPE
jgi:hypothetical protein